MKMSTLALVIVLSLSVIRVAAESNTSSYRHPNTTRTTLPVGKYTGYTMDGWTSASKLAAQRSHTVAGKDERNFAVFTGIVVILMVVFFSQIILGKK